MTGLDTDIFEGIIEQFDEPLVCQDEYSGHGDNPPKAEWFTSHPGCGYYICNGCRKSDEAVILQRITEGDPIGCMMCGQDNIDAHSIKYTAI